MTAPRPVLTPLLVLERDVVFPGDLVTAELPRSPRTEAGDAGLLVALARQTAAGSLGPEAVLPVGCRARLVSERPLREGRVRVVLLGLERVRVVNVREEGGALFGEATPLVPWPPVDERRDRSRSGSSLRAMLASLAAIADDDPSYAGELLQLIPLYGEDSARITDLAAAVLPLDYSQRASLLNEADGDRRVLLLERFLGAELVRRRAGHAVDDKVAAGIRRDYLRKQLDVLRDELGEARADKDEARELADRIEAAALPAPARRAALRELAELRRANPTTPEASRLRNHLDWMLELPWQDDRPLPASAERPFERVIAALEESHVGLREAKGRVAEFLAVRRLGGNARGSVLCFLGPPGTGKTSMGRAVAGALGRDFVTIAVGAMTHESDLVGVPARQASARPGAILAGIHRCGSKAPVVLLDEVDKLRLGGEGTSAGALLQLLDPEQNSEFLDQYLGVPFDLSRCLFLATANDLEAISDALRDRMEIIDFAGYAESEKYEIARQHLLARALTHGGLSRRQLRVTPGALRSLIRGYTEEAGVRQLQRHLITLARKAAIEAVQRQASLTVKKDDLATLLGPRTVDEEPRRRRPSVGVATGLAWTSVGGSLLPIESLAMPGTGRMTLTGQVGDVLRESVQTAITFVRTRFRRLGLPMDVLDHVDVHMHFPSGATPKDGPSAGIAIATALLSLLTGRPSRHEIAMTGEMSLLGTVLPVGGLREKLLAAIRAGIPEVIVPARSAEEVLQLSAEIRGRLVIHLVDDADQVFELALLPVAGRVERQGAARRGRQAARRAKRRGSA